MKGKYGRTVRKNLSVKCTMPHLEILAKSGRTKATWSRNELNKVPSLKICTQICQSFRIASYFPPLACVKIWDLRFVDCANLLLQESKGQTYGLSPVWMRTWVRRLKSKENLLPQPSNVHCWEKAIQCFTPIIMMGKCHTCFIPRDHVLQLIHEACSSTTHFHQKCQMSDL